MGSLPVMRVLRCTPCRCVWIAHPSGKMPALLVNLADQKTSKTPPRTDLGRGLLGDPLLDSRGSLRDPIVVDRSAIQSRLVERSPTRLGHSTLRIDLHRMEIGALWGSTLQVIKPVRAMVPLAPWKHGYKSVLH
jgi:hypothetical protein